MRTCDHKPLEARPHDVGKLGGLRRGSEHATATNSMVILGALGFLLLILSIADIPTPIHPKLLAAFAIITFAACLRTVESAGMRGTKFPGDDGRG